MKGFNKFTKIIGIGLAVSLMLSAAGCKKQEEEQQSVNTGEIPEQLTIFAPLNTWVSKIGKDNNAILGFQMLEEKTGCHVEWIHPAGGGDAFNEKFNLMLASGELPDVIVAGWPDIQGGAQMYLNDKVIIDLTDKMEEYMPNLTKFGKENPEIKKQYTNDDGQILFLPFVRMDPELKVYLGPQIRKDWLEKLGLSVPTTTDELYEVLKAFKTQDPNGNGEADEIPMSGSKFTDSDLGIGQLIWPFGAHYDFYVSDGKVKYGIMEPEFEEGLTYVRKLFAEGLIDMDYLLLDRNKIDGKVMNDKVGFLFSYQPTKFAEQMKDRNPEFKMQGIAHLKGPDGKNHCFTSDYKNDIISNSAAITTANPNPEGTMKWFDFIYGEEGHMMMNFGREGETYEMVDGYPKMTDLVMNNPDGLDVSTAFAKYVAAYTSSFPMLQDWRYYEQSLNPVGAEAIKTWATDVNIDGILPKISFSAEEQQEIAQKMTQIKTYTEEQIDKIILGKLPIEELSNVRDQVAGMGINDVLKIYQDAYDRYIAR